MHQRYVGVQLTHLLLLDSDNLTHILPFMEEVTIFSGTLRQGKKKKKFNYVKISSTNKRLPLHNQNKTKQNKANKKQ